MNNEFDFVTEWNYFEYTMFDESLDNILLSELNTLSRKGNLIRGGADASMRATSAIGRTASGYVNTGFERIRSGEAAAHIQKRINGFRSRFCSGEFWRRIIQMIRELWGKFRNVMATIFKSDENFINNEMYNVKTIIRNAVDSNTLKTGDSNIDITMYPYWLGHDTIMRLDIPKLNINDQNMIESLSNGDSFMQNYIKGVNGVPYNDGNFTEALTAKFRGGNSEIRLDLNSLNANIDKIIKICKDNSRIVRQLERISSNQTQAANDALRIVNGGNGEENIKLLMAIQQYQSIGNKVLACAKGVVTESLNKCIAVCKSIMRTLRSAGSDEIENERLKDETGGVNDARSRGMFGSRKDLDNAIPTNIKTSQETMNSLGDNPKKIAKKISSLTAERDNLKKFVTSKRIPMKTSNPKYKIIHDRVQDYNRQIAMLNARLNQLTKQ